MLDLTQKQIQDILKTVNDGLSPSQVEREFNYYTGLYPQGVSERDIAASVSHYPGLHPQMVEIIEKITALTSSGRVFSIWMDDEDQAGSLLGRALALYDKKYCALFAENLLYQDLDHEVNQNDYIADVVDKWGICADTVLLLYARMENPGQFGLDFVGDMLEEYGELEEYLPDIGIELEDGSYEDWGGEEGSGGCQMLIQDKQTLELLILCWDENLETMAVTCKMNETKAYEYASYEALLEEVSSLEQRCEKLGYAWDTKGQSPVAQHIIQYGDVVVEPPVDILGLFTPKGEQTAMEKMGEEQQAGEKKVLCRKVQFYRDIIEPIIFYLDLQGKRILKIPEYEAQFLWEFDTEEDTYQALEEMKKDLVLNGYELVLEEEVPFVFDYAVKVAEETAGVLAQRKNWEMEK